MISANKCYPPFEVENAQAVIVPDGENSTTGSQYAVTCEEGYTTYKSQRSFTGALFCNNHGNWTKKPSCNGMHRRSDNFFQF